LKFSHNVVAHSIETREYRNMKKTNKLLITLILVLFYNTSLSQCKSDLEQQNIKGKVKTIKETGLYSEDGANEINHIKTTKYDKRGKELGYSFASKYDDLKPTETIFEFDNEGNKIKENRYDLSGKIENYLNYEYDSLGNVIKSSYFTSSGSLDSYATYKYNLTCDRIESKHYYSDSSIWLWYKSTYKKGGLIEVFSPLDSITVKFTYDNQNNYIKYIEYDKLGEEKEVRTYIYEYDDKSNWIKKTEFQNGEIYWVDERQYDYYD
jgi:hypothetical protein